MRSSAGHFRLLQQENVQASDVFGTQIHFSASLSLLHKQMRASRTLISGGSQCGATRSVITPGCFPAAHRKRFVQTAGSSLCQATTASRQDQNCSQRTRWKSVPAPSLHPCSSGSSVCCGSRVHDTVTRVWLGRISVLRLFRGVRRGKSVVRTLHDERD